MPDADTLERRFAAALSVAMVAAVVVPVRQNWRRRPSDGFPLSYYPMFSARRRATARVIHLIGADAAGRRTPLPHQCAGHGGFNQVRRQIGRACGRGDALELCELVSDEVRCRAAFAAVVSVQVVESTYRLDDYFLRREALVGERVLAAAAVTRAAP